MIIFGTVQAIQGIELKNTNIFNLSSFVDSIPRINILPTFVCQPGTEQVFDQMYAQYILGNDAVFYEFMKVMISVYYGSDVYLVISDTFDYANESLQKFILARYGIVCGNVRTLDDWESVQPSSFDINGIYNMDQDKERYIKLFIAYNGVKEYNKINNMLIRDGV